MVGAMRFMPLAHASCTGSVYGEFAWPAQSGGEWATGKQALRKAAEGLGKGRSLCSLFVLPLFHLSSSPFLCECRYHT